MATCNFGVHHLWYVHHRSATVLRWCKRGAEIGPLESPHYLFKAIPLGRCPNLGMGMAKSTDEC